MFAAMNLKKKVILIYSLLSLIFVSCSKEDATRSGEMGTFTMSLNATSEVIGLNEKSRAEEAGEGETLILPDVNDFSVSISSLGEITHFIACEGTQAVLAKVVFGTSLVCARCFVI